MFLFHVKNHEKIDDNRIIRVNIVIHEYKRDDPSSSGGDGTHYNHSIKKMSSK